MVRHAKSLLVALTALTIAIGTGYIVDRYRHVPVTPVQPPSAPVRAGAPEPRFHDLPARLMLLAGDGTAGFRDGANARFADPWGVAVAPDGRVFVADAGDTDRIRVIDRQGRVTTFSGAGTGYADGAPSVARFDTPSGLAIDEAGRLYVADTGNDAIRRVSADGAVSTLAGGHGPGFTDGKAVDARFNGPLGVAVDRNGGVYVADTYNHRIRRIGTDGIVSTIAGGRPGFQDGPGAQARFDTPCGIAVDPDGSLWIADTGNRAIRHIAVDGTVSTLAKSERNDHDAPLRRPFGIAADSDAIYVAEASQSSILRYGHDGALRFVTGDDAGGQHLSRPAGLALDGSGLVVSDSVSSRVYRVQDGPGAPAPVGRAPDAPLPDTHGLWPIAPQDGWHEIVGVAGEVRGNDKGESRDHLHTGVDVRADVGATVYAVADGKVRDPIAAWGYGKLSEGLAIDGLDYIHMRVGRDGRGRNLDPRRFDVLSGDDGKPERVQVRRGTRFHAGDALGTVNAMAHTHLQLDGNVAFRNPIALGFKGFVDHVAPVIDAIQLRDAAGRVVPRGRSGRVVVKRTDGALDIVVEAWDQMDGNLPRRRLGLYSLGYQLVSADGHTMPGYTEPTTNLVFDRFPDDDAATRIIYAADSGETVHGSARTRFLYMATNTLHEGQAGEGHWDISRLPPGNYTLHIVARDWSGNTATHGADLPITVQ